MFRDVPFRNVCRESPVGTRAAGSAVTSLASRDQDFGPIHSGVSHNWVPANVFHSSFFLLLSWSSLLMERIQFKWDCLLPELLVEISTVPFHSYFISLSLPCWLNVSSFLCSLPKEANSILQLQQIPLAAKSGAAQWFYKPFQHTASSPAASPALHAAARRKGRALLFLWYIMYMPPQDLDE